MTKSSYANGHSTIHHLPFDFQEERSRFAYGEQTPSESDFTSLYTPAETILGVTDPEKAYHHAQGFVVNREQNAVHVVRSACPGDIIEIVYTDGTQEFYFVDPIGFDKLPFENPAKATAEQTATDSEAAL